MIPLRDNIPSRSTPFLTWTLIGVNVLVFLLELFLPAQSRYAFLFDFALIPARLSLYNPSGWYTLLTNLFLHAGWFHLLTNAWTLWIFGNSVENRMGSGRFFVFYLFAGVFANLIQILSIPGSRLPVIGASGAIAGVLGAYIFLYPTARVITLIPVFIFPWVVHIPAVLFLGFWFVSQLFSGMAVISLTGQSASGGTAWWAHIGGFIFGLLLVRLFTPPGRFPPSIPPAPQPIKNYPPDSYDGPGLSSY